MGEDVGAGLFNEPRPGVRVRGAPGEKTCVYGWSVCYGCGEATYRTEAWNHGEL
ncbi:hypothetical protein PC116_g19001 [Phytophthora cactorum]|nr:hypothetical protein C6341_g12175 [Phytophthora cactorum]KAG4232773.1 hypothetical protein PC116_g19001 [Phytophthora cactorum]